MWRSKVTKTHRNSKTFERRRIKSTWDVYCHEYQPKISITSIIQPAEPELHRHGIIFPEQKRKSSLLVRCAPITVEEERSQMQMVIQQSMFESKAAEESNSCPIPTSTTNIWLSFLSCTHAPTYCKWKFDIFIRKNQYIFPCWCSRCGGQSRRGKWCRAFTVSFKIRLYG